VTLSRKTLQGHFTKLITSRTRLVIVYKQVCGANGGETLQTRARSAAGLSTTS